MKEVKLTAFDFGLNEKEKPNNNNLISYGTTITDVPDYTITTRSDIVYRIIDTSTLTTNATTYIYADISLMPTDTTSTITYYPEVPLNYINTTGIINNE